MGYHKYDLKKPVLNQVNELRPVLKSLVALNKEPVCSDLPEPFRQQLRGRTLVGFA